MRTNPPFLPLRWSQTFRTYLFTLALAAFGYLWTDVSAQTTTLGPADTSNPAATLTSFINSCNDLANRLESKRYFNREAAADRQLVWQILDCIDVSQLPEFEREEMALESACYLKEVLDRLPLPPQAEWPTTQEVGQWRIPGSRIVIQQLESGTRQFEYVFSANSIDIVVDYYLDIKGAPYRMTGPAVSSRLLQHYLSVPGHPILAPVIRILPEWL